MTPGLDRLREAAHGGRGHRAPRRDRARRDAAARDLRGTGARRRRTPRATGPSPPPTRTRPSRGCGRARGSPPRGARGPARPERPRRRSRCARPSRGRSAGAASSSRSTPLYGARARGRARAARRSPSRRRASSRGRRGRRRRRDAGARRRPAAARARASARRGPPTSGRRRRRPPRNAPSARKRRSAPPSWSSTLWQSRTRRVAGQGRDRRGGARRGRGSPQNAVHQGTSSASGADRRDRLRRPLPGERRAVVEDGRRAARRRKLRIDVEAAGIEPAGIRPREGEPRRRPRGAQSSRGQKRGFARDPAAVRRRRAEDRDTGPGAHGLRRVAERGTAAPTTRGTRRRTCPAAARTRSRGDWCTSSAAPVCVSVDRHDHADVRQPARRRPRSGGWECRRRQHLDDELDVGGVEEPEVAGVAASAARPVPRRFPVSVDQATLTRKRPPFRHSVVASGVQAPGGRRREPGLNGRERHAERAVDRGVVHGVAVVVLVGPARPAELPDDLEVLEIEGRARASAARAADDVLLVEVGTLGRVAALDGIRESS